ncbi:hypothetical protein [Modestobacter sp. SSW1-42]
MTLASATARAATRAASLTLWEISRIAMLVSSAAAATVATPRIHR